MSLLLGFGLLLSTFSTPVYSAEAKTYPYAIQIGVFDTETKATRFIESHSPDLKTALTVKFHKYHVLYNAYETKTEAEKYLTIARKVSSTAYIFKIKTENQAMVDAQMLKSKGAVQESKPIKSEEKPQTQPKVDTPSQPVTQVTSKKSSASLKAAKHIV